MRILAVLTLLTVGFAACATAAERSPNVVFILADDLGYGDVGCFGQQRFETPHLDRLAERGMRLTQHYAGSTVCAPSRCALMTGLHTGHTPVRGNREFKPEGQVPMPADTVTLAELLKRSGYATGCFGKWGLGYPGSASAPLKMGFDHFYGYNCQRHAHRYYTDYLWDDGERVEIDPTAYTHDLIFDRALEFVRTNGRRPFFCFLPVTIPHAAMEAPEEARAPFRKQFARFDETVGKYAGSEVTNPIASFAAMVTRLDGDVGRMMALLEELGLSENTLVVFTSDNGPHVEGGHDPRFFDSNGPYRGFKRDLYEGGIRMPTIACWPGKVAAGSESDFVSAGWDWLPTLCEAAGNEPPKSIDGISLLPTLTGRGEQPTHEYLYWDYPEVGGREAIRRGDWKAIRYRVNKNPNSTPELYNLETDPSETTNVAAEHPDIVAELAELMRTARREPTR